MSWDITLLNMAMLCIYIYIYTYTYTHVTYFVEQHLLSIGSIQVQAGDDLAKMLGEAALLADLGPLLRMKQVRRSGPGRCWRSRGGGVIGDYPDK